MGQDPLAGDVPLTTLAKEYHQKWQEARQRMEQAAYKPAPEAKLRLFAVIPPKEKEREPDPGPRLPPIADPQLRADLQAILRKHEATWALIVNHSRKYSAHPPRREIYAYLHKRGWSLAKIARFCNRDHTSILHALRRGGYVGEHTRHPKAESSVPRGLPLCGSDEPKPEAHIEV
jgi:hypothetical protein